MACIFIQAYWNICLYSVFTVQNEVFENLGAFIRPLFRYYNEHGINGINSGILKYLPHLCWEANLATTKSNLKFDGINGMRIYLVILEYLPLFRDCWKWKFLEIKIAAFMGPLFRYRPTIINGMCIYTV